MAEEFKLEEEIERLTKIIEENPEEAEVYFERGNAYLNLEEYEKAIKDYNKTLEFDPNNADAELCKGVLLGFLNNNENAILCLDKIPETSEKYFDAQFFKGSLLIKLDRNKDAILCLDKIPVTSKKYFDAQLIKGNLLIKLDRNEEAILCFDKIPESSKKYFDAQLIKGSLLIKLDRNEDAILCLDKILETSEKYFDVQYIKGCLLVKLDRNKEAIIYLDKIPEINEKYLDAQFFKGTSFVKLDRNEEAISCFDKIPETGEKYFDVQIIKGNSLIKLDRSEEAILCFDKIPETSEKYFDVQFFKGNLLIKLDKNEEALSCLDKIPQTSDRYLDAQFLKGISFLLLDKAENAAKSFVNAKKESFDVLRELSKIANLSIIKNVISKMIDYNDKDFFNMAIKPKQVNGNKRSEYKKIYINALYIIVLLHVENKNEVSIAHYTRRTASAKLLFESSPFRLNSIITANDPQEGKTLLKNFKLEESDNEELENEKYEHDYQAFIGCFTFNIESLNQFRLYGKEADKEATGISIIINKEFFNEKANVRILSKCLPEDNDKKNKIVKDRNLQSYALYRCIYLDPDTQKVISLGHKEEYYFYREFRNKDDKEIDNLIKEYKKNIEKIKREVNKCLNKLDKSIKEGNNLDYNIICELLLPLRYLVKHVAYKEEQECRIFDIKDLKEDKLKEKNKREIKFTSDYAQMFIEYQPITEYVKKVIFAPKTEVVEIFKKAIEQEGLNVKYDVSTHPFS